MRLLKTLYSSCLDVDNRWFIIHSIYYVHNKGILSKYLIISGLSSSKCILNSFLKVTV